MFSLLGVRISIGGEDSEGLAGEFDFYTNRPNGAPVIAEVKLLSSSDAPNVEELPARPAHQVFSDCVLYKEGNDFLYDYGGKAQLRLQRSERASNGYLRSADAGLRNELGYLYLQSEMGRYLDLQGLHRVHGFAFVPHGTKDAILVLLPSGGGKSTLAFEFLRQDKGLLLSDDSPIIDRRGNVYPFLHRLGATELERIPEPWRGQAKKFERRKFGPKWVVPVSALPSSCLPRPDEKFPIAHIVLGERHGSLAHPQVTPLKRHKAALPLMRDLVVGLGVPQVAELLLTNGLGSLPGLAPVAASRFAAAASTLARSKIWRLRLSRNGPANLEALLGIGKQQ